MQTKTTYLVGQKLSDYQFDKVLKAFAHGVPADIAVTAGSPVDPAPVSAKTAFQIYGLVRKRLVEIGFFEKPLDYLKGVQGDPDHHRAYIGSGVRDRIAAEVVKRRGLTEQNAEDHLAEAIFRVENMYVSKDAFYRDIRSAIRTTGPLNRPPVNMDIWYYHRAVMRAQRSLTWLRHTARRNPAGHNVLIENFQRLLLFYGQELDKAKRRKRDQA
ncbi:hypothetical protein GC173_02915 [bacterium]|nr:hypothetical protein [bacterium]